MKLAWQQHDVYHSALRTISDAVEKLYRESCYITGVKIPQNGWPKDSSFDHRTIQDVHDRLAAVWRYYFKPAQGRLLLAAQCDEPKMDHWLEWLRAELQKWESNEPDFIRMMVEIFQNQNEEHGCDAEYRLNFYLFERFNDIPWKHELINPAAK